MGPILWQFPPSFKFDPELFESFLRQLPHDSEAALAIAKGCEPRMEGRSYLAIDRKRPMRHAVRSATRASSIPSSSTCCASTGSPWWWPIPQANGRTRKTSPATSSTSACTVPRSSTPAATPMPHWMTGVSGSDAGARGSQPDDARLISEKKPRARRSRDVYCYFDNDVKVRAPYDARQLLAPARPGRTAAGHARSTRRSNGLTLDKDHPIESADLDAHMATAVNSIRILTVNTHKGFTASTTASSCPSCAKRCAACQRTWCSCRKCWAPTKSTRCAFTTGRRRPSTSFSPTASGPISPTGAMRSIPTATMATPCSRNFPSSATRTSTSPSPAPSVAACCTACCKCAGARGVPCHLRAPGVA